MPVACAVIDSSFCVALALEENHFDTLVTYPGADGVYNCYSDKSVDQTAIWTRDGEWFKAIPIHGIIVVNIGDFLQRVSNDRFMITMQRVFQERRRIVLVHFLLDSISTRGSELTHVGHICSLVLFEHFQYCKLLLSES
ncbi:hypothetical protein BKA64DRAFT_26352 [Cadophora sp. MPI-SDFR-AT-0126]|nr:hypothetical protein BKA64DRAFT_26352 [Leotiomycetes sp. MPI-SDFR-AT-0126]